MPKCKGFTTGVDVACLTNTEYISEVLLNVARHSISHVVEWAEQMRHLVCRFRSIRKNIDWIKCIPVSFRSIYRSLSSFRPEQELRIALEDGFAEQEAGARLRPGKRKMQRCRSRPARLKLKHKQMSDTIEGKNRSGAWPHLPKACYHDQGFPTIPVNESTKIILIARNLSHEMFGQSH